MGDIYQYLFITALVIASASLILAIFFLMLKFFILRGKIKNKYVVFEVKPLYQTLQSALSTQQLFTLIHGLLGQRTFLDKLIDNYKSCSFEIVSTKREGIRYLIRINKEDADLIKRSLLSCLPGIAVNKVKDYLPAHISAKPYKRVVNFKLSKHFAYP